VRNKLVNLFATSEANQTEVQEPWKAASARAGNRKLQICVFTIDRISMPKSLDIHPLNVGLPKLSLGEAAT
jgi:hypothetical protein